MVAGLLPIAGVGTLGLGGRVINTLADKKKGDISNKLNCLSDHIQNDSQAGLALGVPTGIVAGTAIAKPSVLTKLANATGKVIGKLGTFIQKHITKSGLTENGFLTKILKNPTKAGAIGLIGAGVAYALNVITKHSEKAGRIDQLYEDKAKLEAASKTTLLG